MAGSTALILRSPPPKPAHICDGLYLGDKFMEKDLGTLQLLGITHVLQVGSGLSPSHPGVLTYKSLFVDDEPGSDLVRHFPVAFAFIGQALKAGRLLVHCHAGRSRSAATVVAWLMCCCGKAYEDALALVVAARPSVNPNDGFRLQLQLAAALHWRLDTWPGWNRIMYFQVRSLGVDEMARQVGGSIARASQPAVSVPPRAHTPQPQRAASADETPQEACAAVAIAVPAPAT